MNVRAAGLVMVADDPHLRGFVDRFTQLNRGRAYYSDLENLGAGPPRTCEAG